jgi:hypothetical protein
VEDFCLKAHEKGFVSLGFSAHAPMLKKTGIVTDRKLGEDRLGEYLDEVRAAKRRCEDLDDRYGEAREALLAAGYTETVLFEGRKGGLAQWRAEKLL